MAKLTNHDLSKLFNQETVKEELIAILDCNEKEALETISYKFDNIVDTNNDKPIDLILDLVFVYKNYEYECDKLAHSYPVHKEKLNKIKKLVWKLTNMDELIQVYNAL